MRVSRTIEPRTESTTAHKAVLVNSVLELSGTVDWHEFDVPLVEKLIVSHDTVELEEGEAVCNALGYIERRLTSTRNIRG